MREKTWFRTSVSSSAPIRPRRAKRSESAVNPEMSTKQHVASRLRQLAPGASRSHSAAIRGRYGKRVASTQVEVYAGTRDGGADDPCPAQRIDPNCTGSPSREAEARQGVTFLLTYTASPG